MRNQSIALVVVTLILLYILYKVYQIKAVVKKGFAPLAASDDGDVNFCAGFLDAFGKLSNRCITKEFDPQLSGFLFAQIVLVRMNFNAPNQLVSTDSPVEVIGYIKFQPTDDKPIVMLAHPPGKPNVLLIRCMGMINHSEEIAIEYGVSDYIYAENYVPATAHSCDDEQVSQPTVYKGFWDIYSQIREPLVEMIKSVPNVEMYVVAGYSLGGITAPMICADVDGPDKSKTVLYTYAQCRIENEAFVKLLKNIPWYKTFNTADILPQIPLPVMPKFNNDFSPFLFADGGTPKVVFTNNQGSYIKNHFPFVYSEGILKTLIA